MDFLTIDISGDVAQIARFQRRRGSLVLAGATTAACDAEGLAEALAPVRANATEETKIILTIPPTLLASRPTALPIADRRKLREVLPLELRGETAVDSDELVFDALPLGSGKQLAVWTRKNEISRLIELLSGCGVEPEIVTAAPFHWHHLLPEEGRAGCSAITDGSALAVCENGQPASVRAIGDAQEITRTLAAFEIARGAAVDCLYLIGPAAGELEAYSGSAGVPVLLLPVSGELNSTFNGDEVEARRLAGLFAAALAARTGEALNFRSGDLAYTAGSERSRKKLLVTFALAALLALLLFVDAGMRYYLVNKDLISVNNSIATIYREIFPARKKAADEVGEVKAEIRKMGGTGSRETLATLKLLAEAKNEDMTGIYEAELEGSQVRIKGDARSAQAVNEFKSRVEPHFSSIEIGEIKSKPDGTASFVLRGTLKEAKR